MNRKVIREVFNFKSIECQQKFFEATNNTAKFSGCFSDENKNFSGQTHKFWKNINGTFHQCFKKIRVTNKSSRKPMKDEIQSTIELKTKLQNFLRRAKSPFSSKFIKTKIESLEKKSLNFLPLEMQQ